jgi:hypothetical protein
MRFSVVLRAEPLYIERFGVILVMSLNVGRTTHCAWSSLDMPSLKAIHYGVMRRHFQWISGSPIFDCLPNAFGIFVVPFAAIRGDKFEVRSPPSFMLCKQSFAMFLVEAIVLSFRANDAIAPPAV